jgi:hypothetical protein
MSTFALAKSSPLISNPFYLGPLVLELAVVLTTMPLQNAGVKLAQESSPTASKSCTGISSSFQED